MKNIPHHAHNDYIQLSFLKTSSTKHRLCQICGISFLPAQNSAQRYCSRKCSAIGSKKARPTHTCLTCGKQFPEQSTTFNMYCSMACFYQRTRKTTTYTCLTCGCTFERPSYTKTRTYCSPQCRNMHLNKTLPRKHVSKWSPEELKYLSGHYLTDGAEAVAQALDKTHDQVVDKANKLKISNRRIGMIARLHRDKPSGYELKIRDDLNSFEISYEASVVIKDKFIVDIKIGNLIIEADGDYWHGHPRFEPLTKRQLQQQTRDAARNKYLIACGYTIERIWESDYCIAHLKSILQKHNIICTLSDNGN